MQVIFSIPDDVYNNKEVQHIIDNTNVKLGMIDERITCKDVSEEPGTYQYELVKDLQDDLKGQGIESIILLEGNEAVDKIAKKLHDNIYDANWYRRINGGFVNIRDIAALKYTEDGKEVIEFFARIKHGVSDKEGVNADEFDHQSKWTADGEFISN